MKRQMKKKIKELRLSEEWKTKVHKEIRKTGNLIKSKKKDFLHRERKTHYVKQGLWGYVIMDSNLITKLQ